MLSIHLRKTGIASSLASLILTICIIPTAGAVDLGPPAIGLCFGGGQSGITYVNLDSSGNVGIIAPTRDVTVNADVDANSLSEAQIKLTIELLDDTGTRIWRRSGFTVASNDIVSAEPLVDNAVPATPTNFLNLPPTRHFGFYPFGFFCEGYGIVESGGQRYLMVSSGIAGVDEDGANDATIVKIWLVDVATGDIVQTHRIIPQGGKFALIFDSGVVDFDNDGDDELVVVRSSFLGTNGDQSRFRITVNTFNLISGSLELNFNTIVSDFFVNENPLP